VIPGILTANDTKELAFDNFTSQLENKGEYVKVMIKI
jgi:hypothetical protein